MVDDIRPDLHLEGQPALNYKPNGDVGTKWGDRGVGNSVATLAVF